MNCFTWVNTILGNLKQHIFLANPVIGDLAYRPTQAACRQSLPVRAHRRVDRSHPHFRSQNPRGPFRPAKADQTHRKRGSPDFELLKTPGGNHSRTDQPDRLLPTRRPAKNDHLEDFLLLHTDRGTLPSRGGPAWPGRKRGHLPFGHQSISIHFQFKKIVFFRNFI